MRDRRQPLGDQFGAAHDEAAALHAAHQPRQKGLVVIDDQKRSIVAHGAEVIARHFDRGSGVDRLRRFVFHLQLSRLGPDLSEFEGASLRRTATNSRHISAIPKRFPLASKRCAAREKNRAPTVNQPASRRSRQSSWRRVRTSLAARRSGDARAAFGRRKIGGRDGRAGTLQQGFRDEQAKAQSRAILGLGAPIRFGGHIGRADAADHVGRKSGAVVLDHQRDGIGVPSGDDANFRGGEIDGVLDQIAEPIKDRPGCGGDRLASLPFLDDRDLTPKSRCGPTTSSSTRLRVSSSRISPASLLSDVSLPRILRHRATS